MKIELVKETKIDGESFYFTQVNNQFVDKSLSFDYDTAKAMYNRIGANQGLNNAKEVLESVEVAESNI